MCDWCIHFKCRPQKAVMENIQATHLLQLIHLDYVTIKVTEGGKDVHMLVIADHFMQYMQALVTSLQTAKCTAQALWGQIIFHYGLLKSIVSDQGWNFKGDLIAELCKLARVQKLCTSPCHPQMNGQCECFNHTLINMLGTLPPHKTSSWIDMLLTLVHVHNCTRSTAMRFSPDYLMHDQKPWLTVDLYFGIHRADMNVTASTKCVQQLCERLKCIYKTAQHVIEKENKRHKQNYDHKVRCTQLEVGDMVLLKRMGIRGKHKIQDHWKKTISHLDGQPYVGLPVSRITPVAGEVKVKLCTKTCYSYLEATLMRSQQGVDRPQDCILAVSDDGLLETEVLSTDPKPMGEGHAINVQCVQTVFKLNYWVKTIWGWV